MQEEPTGEGDGFPQLDLARDPRRMLEVFRNYLRPLDGTVSDLRDCSISAVKTAGGRCLLQYALRLVDAAGGERQQIVTGIIYNRGRTRRAWERLESSGETDRIPAGSLFAPVSYLPALDMLVQVFPYDYRLPALAELMAGPPAGFAELAAIRFGAGDWRVERWAATAVRYRVDMRAALRVVADLDAAVSGRRATWSFYAKVYREVEVGARAERILQALSEQAADHFAVGRPIAYLSDRRVLLQEEVPGVSLLEVARKKDGEALAAVRRVARAVAALHRLPLADAIPARRRHRHDEVDQIRRLGERLRAIDPASSPGIDRIVETVVAGLGEGPTGPTHGDLKPGHILLVLDGERVGLLDFDKLGIADPLQDVANLLVNLEKERARAPDRRRHARAVSRAFLDEYFADVPAGWRERLAPRYAAALLGEATTERVRRRRGEANRAERVAPYVRAAEEALGLGPAPIAGAKEGARLRRRQGRAA